MSKLYGSNGGDGRQRDGFWHVSINLVFPFRDDDGCVFFFNNKTPSISYTILQMRVLYTNPCRDVIVPSYVDAH